MDFTRRHFIATTAASAAFATATGGCATTKIAKAPADTPWLGEKIVDCHFHERASTEAMLAHIHGSGTTSALMLAFGNSAERYKELHSEYPRTFLGWAQGIGFGRPGPAPDGPPSPFDMVRLVTPAANAAARAELMKLKRQGWKGFAESGAPENADGPEMERVFALASDLDVPMMMHFQKVGLPGRPASPGRGFSYLGPLLKKYPKAKLIGHASDFWGHIDARYKDGGAYLLDKVQPGGLLDRWLVEYPNLYGDLGAPSCLIQMRRDPEFTAGFIKRHQDKLMFGSDCGCADGRGGGGPMGALPPGMNPAPVGAPEAASPPGSDPQRPAGGVNSSNASAMQMRMAAMGGLAGKCIGRELLDIVWKSTDRMEFRKVAWKNAVRVYQLDV